MKQPRLEYSYLLFNILCFPFPQVLEGNPIYLEFAGNLIPVTKSGEQLSVNFTAFRENRLPFTVRLRDPDDKPVARLLFMSQPKVRLCLLIQATICLN